MNKNGLFYRFIICILIASLLPSFVLAKRFGGTIEIEVGEVYEVDLGISQYMTVTGDWSKTGSAFVFVSKGNRGCKIQGNKVGTGTLNYKGVVNADDYEIYYTVTVKETPTLSLTATPSGGEIEKGEKIYLSSTTGADIYYTLNGNTPTTSSSKYSSSGITINESCTLKALAKMSGYNDSPVMTWVYTVKDEPETYVEINSENFPDENFRNYLLQQEYGSDGKLTEKEISIIKKIGVSENNVTSLKGIEYFTALEQLFCSKNNISSIDLSKNTKIEYLSFDDNQLTTLDVSHNIALRTLLCKNNQLTTLDVSKNTALTWIDCSENQLPSLDVSNNTALVRLECSYNALSSLDVSNNIALDLLYCLHNQLSSLDLSNNIALDILQCQSNQLSSLDLSNNTALSTLHCFNNQLTSLDVSKNTALTWIGCSNNQISSLDVSNNTALKIFECNSNQLTSLDVSNNTLLDNFFCGNNEITSLDVSRNTKLLSFSCSSNQLTSLDVSNNIELKYLYCQKNQLTSLDVSKNVLLEKLYCRNNHINEKAMDDLINSLPRNTSDKEYLFNVIDTSDSNEGNVCTKAQVVAAKEKGWTVQCYNGTESFDYEGSDDEPTGFASIGMGTLSDNYLFEDETKVEILQDQTNKNVYKILNPYNGIVNTMMGEAYDGSKELVITILEPGMSIYDVKITKDDLVYFEPISSGYYHDKYNAYIELYHPSAFVKYQSEDDWTHNKVIGYQSDGWPDKIQLAPYYYIEEVGGWDASQEDDAIIITFPRDPAGIKGVTVDEDRNVHIYDLMGRRLEKPRKGINIIGGKKVVVK